MNTQELKKRLASLVREANAVYQLLERELPDFPPEAQRKLDAGICLKCGEKITKKGDKKRGNHTKCHRTVMRNIEKGIYTEAAAISAGLLAPSGRGGRPPKLSPVEKQLERAKAAQGRIDGDENKHHPPIDSGD